MRIREIKFKITAPMFGSFFCQASEKNNRTEEVLNEICVSLKTASSQNSFESKYLEALDSIINQLGNEKHKKIINQIKTEHYNYDNHNNSIPDLKQHHNLEKSLSKIISSHETHKKQKIKHVLNEACETLKRDDISDPNDKYVTALATILVKTLGHEKLVECLNANISGHFTDLELD